MIDPVIGMSLLLTLLTLAGFVLSRTSARHTREIQALTDTTDAKLKDLEQQIGQIFLTEQDRKDIGLPPRQVQVIEKKAGSNGLAPACTVHKWSAEFLERGRLASNRGNYGVDGGNCFVRVCLKCKARQVRGKRISLHSDGSKQNHYHWHSD